MKNQRRIVGKSFAVFLCAFGLLVPRSSESVLGDDLFLLSTSVPPNVVLFLDNSNSMNQIEWHYAFDIDDTPANCDFDNNTMYDTSGLANSETHCGNTRDIFAPENPTLWHGKYLNWYFSSAADPYINEIENDVANVASCNQAGANTRFIQKYRRTRADAAKQVLLDVLCLAEPRGIRFGLAEFREAEDAGDVDPNGGYMSVAIDDSTPAHAADLEASIGNTRDEDAGPLGEAYFTIYSYLMSRVTGERPMMDRDSDTNVSEFPNYGYNANGDVPNNAAQIVDDPMQFSCQKAFVVMVTDGGPTYDTFDQDPTDTAMGYADFMDLVGDYNPDGETEVNGSPEVAWYLDDIVKFANENDFRPVDMVDEQTIDTYMVGFQTDDATNAYLEKTADVGEGLWFEVKDGDQLAEALVAALNDIIEKSHSFTAATVPSARTADGGDFYNSFFLPSAKTAFWEGHLRSWHIDAVGDVRDKFDVCALDDPTPGECNSGRFKPRCEAGVTTDCVTPFWDAADEVPAPFSRNLKVSKVVSGSPAMVSFDQTNMAAADLGVQPFVLAPAQAPNSLLYSFNGSTGINAEGLADEVVSYALGCFLGSGTDAAGVSANVSTPLPCEVRPWTLGDIFHSDPLVVQNPRRDSRLDASHEAFRTGYLNRKRMIYAGTNAGFLEGIDAGTWDTSLDPDDYDEGTGAEVFGFMPWEARTNIRKLPIDFPTARTHYVDGSPQSADIWYYTSATTATPIANGSEWRTYLIGGLRQGGHHYYALDITNSDGREFPTGRNLAYPGYAWEFPDEVDTAGDLAYMGQTWAQPIITRVKVNVGFNNNGGAGFERWVAIVTGGYDETGDPNSTDVTGELAATYDATATAGRAIFIIDVRTGKVLAEQRFNGTGANCPTASAGTPQQNMCFAIPSSPSVLDLDFDGYADVIYVGDLGGNLWKWVISPIGEDRANDGSGLRTQPNWPFRRIFNAPETQISGTKYYRNLYFPPAAAFVSGRLWLAFGSGERGSVAYEGDGSDDDPDARDENNRFYVMSDLDPYETLATPLAEVTEANLTDVTNTQSGATITGRGFFFKAEDGEKFVTRTDIFTGLVIVSSFKPADTGDRCTSRGDATLYIFELGTGDGYFTDGGGNPTRETSIGSGFPTDPKVSIGVGGEDTRIFIEKSGADLESLEAPDVPAGGSYLYWREVN